MLVAVIFLMSSNRETDPMKLTYSQVRDLFRQDQVSSFVLEGDSLILTLKEPYGGRYNVVHELFSFSWGMVYLVDVTDYADTAEEYEASRPDTGINTLRS